MKITWTNMMMFPLEERLGCLAEKIKLYPTEKDSSHWKLIESNISKVRVNSRYIYEDLHINDCVSMINESNIALCSAEFLTEIGAPYYVGNTGIIYISTLSALLERIYLRDGFIEINYVRII